MYAGYIYRLDAEKYEQNKEVLHAKILEFGEDEFMFDEAGFVPLDEAYVVEMCIEGAEGLYLVLVGENHFDEETLKELLYGDEEMYRKYCLLSQKSTRGKWSDEEFECLKYGSVHYREQVDLEEDVQAVLYDGDEELGRLITQIF